MHKEALSLDLDGVVIFRIPIQLKALEGYRKYGIDLYLPPPTIPPFHREIDASPLTPKEKISWLFSTVRFVYPNVRKTLHQLDGFDIYGNTGRPNQKDWVEMTRETLKKGSVLEKFVDIYFAPVGVPSVISKLSAIAELRERYKQVVHVDDNPADALPIAARFPDVEVIIVEDWTTGILFSRVEKNQFPNVRRVAVFKAALPRFNQIL